MGQFESVADFAFFNYQIRRLRRYVRAPQSEKFLRAVALTCKDRLRTLDKGQIYWRAQLGHDWRSTNDGLLLEIAIPHPPNRMKPKRDSAFEGRANPRGIPYLHLATTKIAAMSEVRQWLGAIISVARFEIVRPLTIVDCSILHGQYRNLLNTDEPVSLEMIDNVVWAAIDGAFAEPVMRTDDAADYAATQILAELFRGEGYDGVAYKSAFGEDGFNVALFDLDSARHVDAELYEAKRINFEFEHAKKERVSDWNETILAKLADESSEDPAALVELRDATEKKSVKRRSNEDKNSK